MDWETALSLLVTANDVDVSVHGEKDGVTGGMRREDALHADVGHGSQDVWRWQIRAVVMRTNEAEMSAVRTLRHCRGCGGNDDATMMLTDQDSL